MPSKGETLVEMEGKRLDVLNFFDKKSSAGKVAELPVDVCPVVARFASKWHDSLGCAPDKREELTRPVAAELADTKADVEVEDIRKGDITTWCDEALALAFSACGAKDEKHLDELFSKAIAEDKQFAEPGCMDALGACGVTAAALFLDEHDPELQEHELTPGPNGQAFIAACLKALRASCLVVVAAHEQFAAENPPGLGLGLRARFTPPDPLGDTVAALQVSAKGLLSSLTAKG